MCPRSCGVDRSTKYVVCGVGENPKVAKAYLHMWEEPVISGKSGSGTVFFSGCNLKCVYCQNSDISHGCYGKEITCEALAKIFKSLESKGAANINLVSPSHYTEAICKALDIYRPSIPIVYNSSGYDSVEQLEKLKDYIDIFLVDFKYFDSELAGKYSKAKDYPEVAMKAIKTMRSFIPNEIIEDGVMKKGVIIRHLVLPSHTRDSINILTWIKENINNPFISLMGQYTPMYFASNYPEINRTLKPIEYKIVVEKMIGLGLNDGYTQELSSATDVYTPVFDCEGVEEYIIGGDKKDT
jgi:putative pyruvate formate lyase activating enzyme